VRIGAAGWGVTLAAVVAIDGCATVLGDFSSTGGETSDTGPDATAGDESMPGPDSATADEVTGDMSVSDVGGDATTAGDATDSGDATTSSDGNDASSDASIDATDSGQNDAPNDVEAAGPDAAVYFLTCAFKSPTPIQVGSLEGQASTRFQYPPQVVTMSDNSFEILEIGAGGGPYTLYWVNTNNPNQPVSGVYTAARGIDTGFNVLSFGPVAAGAAIAEQSYGLIASNTYSLSISQPTDNAGNAPSQSFSFVSLPSIGNLGFGYFERSSLADYFWAISGVQGSADAGTLYVGESLAGDGGVTYGTVSTTTQTGGTPVVVPVGGQLRVYLSSSPQKGGAVAYALASTANLDGGIVPRPLSGAITALLIDAKPSASGGTNFGLIEIDLSPTATALATFRVGNVADTAIDTFTAPDLPLGAAISSPTEIPISSGGGGWFGDEFIMVGLGQPNGGGFNLIWQDKDGHSRALQTGTRALLASDMNIDGVGIALSQQLGARFVSWNVAWSDVQTGADGSVYDVLFANQLICSN
jgi:hypothetical protein